MAGSCHVIRIEPAFKTAAVTSNYKGAAVASSAAAPWNHNVLEPAHWRRTMNGYDETPVSSSTRATTSLDDTTLSPPAVSASASVVSASIPPPLHIPAKRLSSSYPHHVHHPHDSSGDGSSLLRHSAASQSWPYAADAAAAAAASASAFDPQYSPSSLVRDGMAAAAAAAYYGADRAKALSFWPGEYGKYGSTGSVPNSSDGVQFNAQAWCGYAAAGYGGRVPEPHGHSLGPAPGQPMGVPVSVAGYLADHEVRRGAMDAAAAVACFPHDGYAGLRGYGTGHDGMPPSVYGPGTFHSTFFFSTSSPQKNVIKFHTSLRARYYLSNVKLLIINFESVSCVFSLNLSRSLMDTKASQPPERIIWA